MLVYFSGSISGGREDVELYRRIVEFLRSQGHRVLAGEVTNHGITHEGEILDPHAIFERDLRWIEEVAAEAGVLVAEVSKPSLGVGYEIAAARYQFGMPVICLWRRAYSRRCSAMIAGDPGVRLLEYREDDEASMLARLSEALLIPNP